MDTIAPPAQPMGAFRPERASTGVRPARRQPKATEPKRRRARRRPSAPSTESLARHAHHLHHAHHSLRRPTLFWTPDVPLVEAEVRRVLRDSPYREHSLLRVHMVGGALELQGKTSTFFMKQMAQELAKAAVPEARVRNLIQVRS